jgi:dihydropteroate synthase
MISWQLRSQTIHFDERPKIMGIVNVTPDSFSDGGRYSQTHEAVSHALKLAADGADILDVGGESTRPYSEGVSVQTELDRVIPVIEALRHQTNLPISVDTSKAVVAQQATMAGAEIINDVTGLQGDPAIIDVALSSGAGICAMHMRGTPQTMQDNPEYSDVVEDIYAWLEARRDWLINRGIVREKICLDPGIGFGKTHEHNLELLRNIERFNDLGCPILVGHSRKGFIGKITGDTSPERIAGTLAVSLHLAMRGTHIIRVHDVRETVQAMRMLRALEVRPKM